jgi:hypothetical protein
MMAVDVYINQGMRYKRYLSWNDGEEVHKRRPHAPMNNDQTGDMEFGRDEPTSWGECSEPYQREKRRKRE